MTMLFRASPIRPFRLIPVTVLLLATPVIMAAPPKPPAPPSPVDASRSSAYYHYGLAHLYEEMAINAGRPDYANQAVEQYKYALDADPNSTFLQDGLADLYFKIGRIKDAVTAAQDQIKRNPNDVAAHTLLGQVYLRSLSDTQGGQSWQVLQLAIASMRRLRACSRAISRPSCCWGSCMR
jgi:predicted Zn-dependent protease